MRHFFLTVAVAVAVLLTACGAHSGDPSTWTKAESECRGAATFAANAKFAACELAHDRTGDCSSDAIDKFEKEEGAKCFH